MGWNIFGYVWSCRCWYVTVICLTNLIIASKLGLSDVLLGKDSSSNSSMNKIITGTVLRLVTISVTNDRLFDKLTDLLIDPLMNNKVIY